MKKIIIANWKMNPASPKEAQRLFESAKSSARNLKKAEVVIAPPFLYLPLLKAGLPRGKAGQVKLAAQDVFWENPPAGGGAFTGEISARMLKNLGVSYVIVGHSERRELGETDELISQKLKAAASGGLRAVLCVGERERVKDSFPTLVRDELKKALKGISRRFASKIIIAYEPVWAVSTGKNARPDTPQDFFEMSIFIRRVILDIWGKSAAFKIPILYGGSVSSKNAAGFLKVKGAAGLLVGKASLNAREFSKILEAVKL